MNSVSRGPAVGFVRVLLAALAVVGTTACFGDDSDEAEGGADTDAAGVEEGVGSDAAAGTLTLGSETFEFVVDACDLAEDPPAGRATLSGHADLPDGRTLQVTMLRTPMGATTWHSVAADFGSEYREARRSRTANGDGWRPVAADSAQSALGPLITIEGRSVAAEGTFLPGSGGTAGPVRGGVTATCPES
ncbi:MAG: hypothetical protein ACODAA_04020 [Gemmatimonadota bacterium]